MTPERRRELAEKLYDDVIHFRATQESIENAFLEIERELAACREELAAMKEGIKIRNAREAAAIRQGWSKATERANDQS